MNKQTNPNANICAMCPNYLTRDYQGLYVKQANKQKLTNHNDNHQRINQSITILEGY